MNSRLEINGRGYEFDPAKPLDISIPLNFGGPQPNAYGAEPATAEAVEAGSLVGDTRRGGSCNFEQYTLVPQCSGTHTECVGHITHERISVRDCLKDAFVAATLVSVRPAKPGEPLITSEMLAEFRPGDEALIVRTLPNDDGKLTRVYNEEIPPYFSGEAMELMVEAGIRHLLVDLPSIDRIYDEGQLANHRIFWNVAPGSFEITVESRVDATITELIYVPGSIADGAYLLNLQIAPFAADAAPSRPILFRVD
ncbi:MAG: cyclase family protein [Acidobacteriota bacterium]